MLTDYNPKISQYNPVSSDRSQYRPVNLGTSRQMSLYLSRTDWLTAFWLWNDVQVGRLSLSLSARPTCSDWWWQHVGPTTLKVARLPWKIPILHRRIWWRRPTTRRSRQKWSVDNNNNNKKNTQMKRRLHRRRWRLESDTFCRNAKSVILLVEPEVGGAVGGVDSFASLAAQFPWFVSIFFSSLSLSLSLSVRSIGIAKYLSFLLLLCKFLWIFAAVLQDCCCTAFYRVFIGLGRFFSR